jgi:hypothetical protein
MSTYSTISEEIKTGSDSDLPVDVSGEITVECNDIVGDSQDKRAQVGEISQELRDAIDGVLDEHRTDE